MSAKRSNSRRSREPLSAFARLRKQHYDRQYRCDIAVYGHSRQQERMRETGRCDDSGNVIQRRNARGEFITGYRSKDQTTAEELNFFLDDLVGVPSTVRFCPTCSQVTSRCVCWDEFPRYDFRSFGIMSYKEWQEQNASPSDELSEDLRLPLSFSQQLKDEEER